MKVLKNFIIAFLVGMFVLALLIKRASAEIILTESNIVPIYGYIGPGTAQSVALRASKLRESSTEKLYFVINSGGGSIKEADQIVQVISMFDNSEVVIIFAASAAAGISQLTDKKVIMIGDGLLMFHHASYGIQNRSLTADQLINMGLELKKYEAEYLNRVGRKIKFKYKDFLVKFKKYKEWYLTSVEAKHLGAVSKIETVECAKSTANLKTKKYSNGELVDTKLCNIKENL